MGEDDGMAFEFRPGRSDESPGRELLAELIAYFNEIYPGRAARPGSVTAPDEMVAPHGVFLVGYEDGEAIAIGGLRPLARTGSARSSGCTSCRQRARAAPGARCWRRSRTRRARSATSASGSTRGREQRHSRALFADTGYVEIERYNANHIADYFAEKRL